MSDSTSMIIRLRFDAYLFPCESLKLWSSRGIYMCQRGVKRLQSRDES